MELFEQVFLNLSQIHFEELLSPMDGRGAFQLNEIVTLLLLLLVSTVLVEVSQVSMEQNLSLRYTCAIGPFFERAANLPVPWFDKQNVELQV